MIIKLVGNNRARETINRLKQKAYDFDILLWENTSSHTHTIYYGVSDFNLSKSEQAELFQEIIPHTIIGDGEFNVSSMNDYDSVIMKNPTRLLLWKDAKRLSGTKYFYIENKSEWRINYSFGKVNSVLNKNVKPSTIFGKADVTQWLVEENKEVRKKLIDITKTIGEVVEDMSNLKSFGIDIIRDNDTNEYYFLELNQANSLNDNGCELFIKSYLEYIEKDKIKLKVNSLLGTLNQKELEYAKELLFDEDYEDEE